MPNALPRNTAPVEKNSGIKHLLQLLHIAPGKRGCFFSSRWPGALNLPCLGQTPQDPAGSGKGAMPRLLSPSFPIPGSAAISDLLSETLNMS